MKIQVKNFQPIASATIEAKGLTVITGRSSIGKSALIRAIAAAFFGRAGDSHIRAGEDTCGVGIEDDGLKLVWRKTTKPTPQRPTALQVGDTIHTKLGRDHAQLTEVLGVRRLETSQTTVTPQVAGQHDPVFLLTDSETVVAEVFKLLSRVDTVTTAQTMATRDKRDHESTLDVRTWDVARAKRECDELADTPSIRKSLDAEKAAIGDLLLHAGMLNGYLAEIWRWANLVPAEIPQPYQGEIVAPPALADLERYIELTPLPVPDAPPAITDPAETYNELVRYSVLADVADQRLIESMEVELVNLVEMADLIKAENPVCPTCERPWDAH